MPETTSESPTPESPKPDNPTPDSGAPRVAQTIEQQRAAYALGEINRLLEAKPGELEFNKEFCSYASALPAMIHMNGLGQAAAFCASKGGTYKLLYDIVSEWMIRDGQPFGPQAGAKPRDAAANLLEGITSSDMYRYRVAQAEALALLEWVKKLALALMPVPKKDGEDQAPEAA